MDQGSREEGWLVSWDNHAQQSANKSFEHRRDAEDFIATQRAGWRRWSLFARGPGRFGVAPLREVASGPGQPPTSLQLRLTSAPRGHYMAGEATASWARCLYGLRQATERAGYRTAARDRVLDRHCEALIVRQRLRSGCGERRASRGL